MTTIGAALVIVAIIGAALALVHQLRQVWGEQIERGAGDDDIGGCC